jgi:hypothetical protein
MAPIRSHKRKRVVAPEYAVAPGRCDGPGSEEIAVLILYRRQRSSSSISRTHQANPLHRKAIERIENL